LESHRIVVPMRPNTPEPPIPPLLLLTPLDRAIRIFGYIVKGEKKGGRYSDFLQPRLVYFLQCVPVKKWDEIKCESIGTTMKATPCDIGRNTKLFYKTKSTTHVGGLGIYIMGLVLGFIKESDHREFVQALQKTFKKRPIRVHNEDVDWFHLKESV
jgi:hypothetical protein